MSRAGRVPQHPDRPGTDPRTPGRDREWHFRKESNR